MPKRFTFLLVALALLAALVAAGSAAAEPAAPAAAEAALPLHHMFVSMRTSGKIGGVAYTPSDILRYDPPNKWSMVFDGSDVGVTKNLLDFEMMDPRSPGAGDDLSILMAFAANQPIAGVGTFKPQDVARFKPDVLGSTTAGAFDWSVVGSSYGLSTLGEKIDGIGETTYHILALSTTGAASVMRPGGVLLKAQNEDALGFHPYWREWSPFFDGTPVRGLGVENLSGLWVDQLTGDLYITMPGAFNLGGVAGNGKDIVRLAPNGAGGYTPSLFWDGSAFGLLTEIDGLEVVLGQSPNLLWPIGCVPGQTCTGVGYPDIDGDGKAFNCGAPGYTGHTGTDIGVSWAQMDARIPVYAAADGVVQWVKDGEYDRCQPGSTHPECQTNHYYCFGPGNYCGTGTCCCTWCFTGNLIVLRHSGLANVFMTAYGHLREGSLLVSPGQSVVKGQKIAEVGSSGNSTDPHLHFDVWGTGFWEPFDPWAGACGPNYVDSMWQYNPPWGGTAAAAGGLTEPPLYGPDNIVPQYETPLPLMVEQQCRP